MKLLPNSLMVILILPAFWFIENVNAQTPANTTFTWDSDSTGTINANGYSTYPDIFGTLKQPQTGNVGALGRTVTVAVGSGSSETIAFQNRKIPGAVSPWSSETNYPSYDTGYGIWYYIGFATICDEMKCNYIRFNPDSNAINKLQAGIVVVSTVDVGSGLVLTVRIEKSGIGGWDAQLTLNSDENPELIGNPSSTTYGDRIGATVLALPVGESNSETFVYSASVYETLNQNTRTDGSMPSAQTTRTIDGKNYQEYGRGFGSGIGKLVSGVWYFSTDQTRILFEPNITGINSLQPTDNLQSKFELKLQRTVNQVTTPVNTLILTVQISRPKLELSFQATSVSGTESNTINIVVESDSNPNGTVSINFTPNSVSPSGYNYLDEGDGALGVQRTNELTFTRIGNTARFETTIRVPTKSANSTDDGNGTFRINLIPSDKYNVVQNSDVVLVNVFDFSSIPVISIHDNSTDIEEGNDAVFTFEASPPANRTIDVKLDVFQSGEFVLYSSSLLRFNIGDATKEFRVPTVDDFIDEDNGSITVEILPVNDGSPYTVGSNMMESIDISDNDSSSAAGGGYSIASNALRMILSNQARSSSGNPEAMNGGYMIPEVSMSSSQTIIEEGQSVDFRVHSSFPTSYPLAVKIKLNDPSGLVAGDLERTLVIETHRTETTFTVQTVDDEIPDDVREISAFVVADEEYATTTQNRISIKVTDYTDRMRYKQGLVEVNNSVTPAILSAMGRNSLATLDRRMETAFSGTNQSSISLAGHSSLQDMIVSSGTILNQDDVDWMSELGNSSFSVNLFPEDTVPGSVTVWGIGNGGIVTGSGGRAIDDWDGEISTATLGFDTRIGDEIILGLSTSASEANIEFEGMGKLPDNYVSKFTGIHPYLGYLSMDARFQMQFITGYAAGEIGIDQKEQVSSFMGSSISFAGINGVQNLYSSIEHDGGFELDLSGEALLAQQFVKDSRGIATGMRADTMQFQLGLDARRELLLDIGAVEPSISLGVHSHRRNQHPLTGMNIATGFNYDNLTGLNFSSSGGAIFTSATKLEALKLGSRLSYDQRPDTTGYNLGVSTDWQRIGSSQGLFHDIDFATDHHTGFGAVQYRGLQVDSVFEYGIGIWEDSSVLTPGIGMKFIHDHAVTFRIGSRLEYGRNVQIELTGAQEITKNVDRDDQLHLNGMFHW